jgi:aminoglycoside 6'-N-acetyltransferase I
MRVRAAEAADIPAWAAMRHALWPDADPEELADDLPAILADPAQFWTLMIVDDVGTAQGFAEIQMRDMFDGSHVDPYPHIEGLWVAPEFRRAGAARTLLDTIVARARAAGHAMIGSDVVLDNDISHAWHTACGFQEEVRVILYSKRL